MSPHEHVPHPLAVLVADDDADTGDSLAEMLALHGHAVRVVRGGEDALRQAAAAPPDVLLLDIRMPRVDGCAVAHALRERVPGANRPLLIAVTGGASGEDRERTAAAGFDLHLVKPVETVVLVAVLARFQQFLQSTGWFTNYDPRPDEAGSGNS